MSIQEAVRQGLGQCYCGQRDGDSLWNYVKAGQVHKKWRWLCSKHRGQEQGISKSPRFLT